MEKYPLLGVLVQKKQAAIKCLEVMERWFFSKNKPNRFVPWVHSFVSSIFHGFYKKTWGYGIFRDKPLPEVPTLWRQIHPQGLIETFLGIHNRNLSNTLETNVQHTPFGNSTFGTKKNTKENLWKKNKQTCFAPSVMQHSLGIATTTQGYDVVRFHLDNQVQVNEGSWQVFPYRWRSPINNQPLSSKGSHFHHPKVRSQTCRIARWWF